MTFDEEETYLFHQYVLTLKNDSAWYKATRAHVSCWDYKTYCHISYPFITTILKERGDKSTSHSRDYPREIPCILRRVTMVLWETEEQLAGDIPRRQSSSFWAQHEQDAEGLKLMSVIQKTSLPVAPIGNGRHGNDSWWSATKYIPPKEGTYEVRIPNRPHFSYSRWHENQWRSCSKRFDDADNPRNTDPSEFMGGPGTLFRPTTNPNPVSSTLASNLEERTDIMPIDNTKPFVSATYVYGQDTSDMTEAQLLGAIKKIEKEIADLKSIGVKSTKIASNIETLEKALAEVVAALDAK